MVKISEIIKIIENFAPLSLASDWDNSGWQIYLDDCRINKVMVALSPTVYVIEQAVAEQCKLLVTHHPLIFNKINRIIADKQTNLAIIKAIQNNIQVYSAHTNLDAAQGGVADRLAELLNIKNIEVYETFVRVGSLEKEEKLGDFLEKIKKTLDINNLKVINQALKKTVQKIAVCPGSGGDMIGKLEGIDLYITADIRFHTALEVNNTVVVDAGHYETERIILPVLKKLISSQNIEVLIAKEKSPWEIV